MDEDQQFCLRWNNHQSTLVSVFDTLLENGTLVDCTLAAEGKYLRAHKVVLSACSPYFEALLTQQYDKHPIFILKDVKFQELKAMMDYMYRGEVNISQDQLAALLKAAESLQIKGLSDSRSKTEETRKPAPPQVKTPPPAPTIPRVQGLTIEQRRAPKTPAALDVTEDSRSREGSTSPVPRKRKKPRRRTSQDEATVLDNHDASNSSDAHSNQASGQNIPASVPLASTSKLTDVPEPTENVKTEVMTRSQKSSASSPAVIESDMAQVPIKEKLETHSEIMLEPKSEYIDEEVNEDSVEDLTLDDDDMNNMDDLDQSRPGPSHGGDGSGQDPWGRFMSPSHDMHKTGGGVASHQPPLINLRYASLQKVRFEMEPIMAILDHNSQRKKYKPSVIRDALDAILNHGVSVSQASVDYKIKRPSLQGYLKKLNIVINQNCKKGGVGWGYRN